MELKQIIRESLEKVLLQEYHNSEIFHFTSLICAYQILKKGFIERGEGDPFSDYDKRIKDKTFVSTTRVKDIHTGYAREFGNKVRFTLDPSLMQNAVRGAKLFPYMSGLVRSRTTNKKDTESEERFYGGNIPIKCCTKVDIFMNSLSSQFSQPHGTKHQHKLEWEERTEMTKNGNGRPEIRVELIKAIVRLCNEYGIPYEIHNIASKYDSKTLEKIDNLISSLQESKTLLKEDLFTVSNITVDGKMRRWDNDKNAYAFFGYEDKPVRIFEPQVTHPKYTSGFNDADIVGRVWKDVKYGMDVIVYFFPNATRDEKLEYIVFDDLIDKLRLTNDIYICNIFASQTRITLFRKQTNN